MLYPINYYDLDNKQEVRFCKECLYFSTEYFLCFNFGSRLFFVVFFSISLVKFTEFVFFFSQRHFFFLLLSLFRSGYCVKAAVAGSRGRLLVMLLVCFQERGEVRVSPRLLPPGKLSFAVGVGRRRDAEDADAQVRGDLQAHTRAVAAQIQSGEDLWKDTSQISN